MIIVKEINVMKMILNDASWCTVFNVLLKGDPEKCPSEEYRKWSIGKTN